MKEIEKINRKSIYVLLFSLACLCFGCGKTDSDGDIDKPGDKEKTISFTVKSGVPGTSDGDLKQQISHVRLYVFDKDEKLLSVTKSNGTEAIAPLKMEAGNYTFVLVGNLPDDQNISSETKGTTLSAMKIQLKKKTGSENYIPVGDILFAKSLLVLSDKDTQKVVEFSVKRTLSSVNVGMEDYSKLTSQVGVLIPGVATEMDFSNNAWSKPATVFVLMHQNGTKAEEPAESRAYQASVSCAVVNKDGALEQHVKCDVIALDIFGEVVAKNSIEAPVKNSPGSGMDLKLAINTNDGRADLTVTGISAKDESGQPVPVEVGDVAVKESEVDVDKDISSDDWTPEQESKPENVTPGGTPEDWQEGNDESVGLEDQ